MKDNKINELLKKIVKSSDLLDILKDKPEQLGENYGLSKEELDALKSADLLLAVNRASCCNPITITITHQPE